MAVNRVAYFLAGAVLGASGFALVRSGKGQALLSGLVQGGYGLTEGVMARVETIKEDIEDYLAEAKFSHEQKVKAEATQQTAPTAAKPAAAGKAAPKAAAKKAAAKAAPKATRKAAAKSAPRKSAAKTPKAE